MSAYNQQEFDFVERTKLIIKQYQALELETIKLPRDEKKEKYPITLLINSFVGLLILPQQEWFGRLPNDLISAKEWGIAGAHISLIKGRDEVTKKFGNEAKSVKNVARHLRNSIAHNNFTVFSNSKAKLSQIKFEDFTNETKEVPTFNAVIPLPSVRQFLDKFSETVLEKMKAEKGI